MVAIKKLAIPKSVKKIKSSRSLLKELKDVTELQHENINPFIGACLEAPYFCLVTEYCGNGSLENLLSDEEFRCHMALKNSFLNDLVNGMTFLHESPIQSHGRLKTSNCVVDDQLVLKITDFSLAEIRSMEDSSLLNLDEHSFFLKQLGIAPELLRMEIRPPKGTQSGDVYSFGIILHEVLYRHGIFYRGEDEYSSTKEIAANVYKIILNTSPFGVENENVETLIELMMNSWAEKPQDRLTFKEIQSLVAQFSDVKNIDHRLLKPINITNIVNKTIESEIQELAEKISLISEPHE
uniref:guanylate cyclase n=1 Tax=Panagrellus redivivus TaxID=6233 RepID=A0A7E4ZQW9_PANRE